MKEATGELNMTVITIVAVGVILGLFIPWLKNTVFPGIQEKWDQYKETTYIEHVDYVDFI